MKSGVSFRIIFLFSSLFILIVLISRHRLISIITSNLYFLFAR